MKFYHASPRGNNEIHIVTDANNNVYGSGKTGDEAWAAACSALQERIEELSETDERNRAESDPAAERQRKDNQVAADLLSELAAHGGAIVTSDGVTPTEAIINTKIKRHWFHLIPSDRLTRYADAIVRGKATDLLRLVAETGGAIFRKQDVPTSPLPQFCVVIEHEEFVHVPADELDEADEKLKVEVCRELKQVCQDLNQLRHTINKLL